MTEIGWTVREYIGTEVYASPEDLKAKKPLKTTPSIGQRILVFHALSGWVWATVKSETMAEDEHYLYPLEFGQDDRDCWVCGSTINKKCIDKLRKAMSPRETNHATSNRDESPKGAID